MSDLFDRMAMRALGSEANLRPRVRTRFEPPVLTERGLSIDAAPMALQPLAISDDPLADGASTIAPHPRPAVRRAEHRAADPDDEQPAAKSGASQDAGHAGGSPDIEKPLDSRPFEPGETLEAATNFIPPPSRRLQEPPLTPAAAAETPRRERPASSPIAPSRAAAAPTPSTTMRLAAGSTDPESVSDSIATFAQPQPSKFEPILGREANPPLSRADTPNGRGETIEAPVPNDSTSPATAERTWQDPLGIQARARIERRSAMSEARPLIAKMRDAGTPATVAPIEITIGRLEIRADAKPPSRPAKTFAPHVDLAAYRSRRERGP